MANCRIAVRGFVGRKVVFEDRIDVPVDQIDAVIQEHAEKHARQMAAHELHMIEIEFLDEPNVAERFFRFGTDPSGMVMPIKIPLPPDPKEKSN